MRSAINSQLHLGEIDVTSIYIDPRSRDDIPQLLRGLQYLYTHEQTREPIFKILEDLTPSGTNTQRGRPGMIGWEILVMGTLRLNLNCDYDHLMELVYNHKTIRQMLGLGFTARCSCAPSIPTIHGGQPMMTRPIACKPSRTT